MLKVAKDLLFPSPIAIVHGTEEGLAEMEAECYAEKLADPTGRNVSNAGGWQSGDDALERMPRAKARILEMLGGGLAALGVREDVGLKLNNSWINISGPGSYNKTHIHGFSVFSGVFYIKAPEGSGRISFENDPHRSMEIGSYTEEQRARSSVYNSYEYPPRPGVMLLFPSTLPHSVGANESEQDRISVAFNLTL